MTEALTYEFRPLPFSQPARARLEADRLVVQRGETTERIGFDEVRRVHMSRLGTRTSCQVSTERRRIAEITNAASSDVRESFDQRIFVRVEPDGSIGSVDDRLAGFDAFVRDLHARLRAAGSEPRCFTGSSGSSWRTVGVGALIALGAGALAVVATWNVTVAAACLPIVCIVGWDLPEIVSRWRLDGAAGSPREYDPAHVEAVLRTP